MVPQSSAFMNCVFFFQAEDGIRDLTVTGVQTCALPILIAQGKRDGLTYASPGSGSPMHILGEMFNRAAGTRIAHIPYKGVAPAVNDLIGGHVPTTDRKSVV